MRASPDKIAVLITTLCLVIGADTHVFDNMYFGLFPYNFAPTWINIYWTSLGALDLLAIYLLFKSQKLGIVLTLFIMLSDGFVNSLAYYSLNVISDSLPLPTLFSRILKVEKRGSWEWSLNSHLSN